MASSGAWLMSFFSCNECSCIGGQITPTRNNNRRKSVCCLPTPFLHAKLITFQCIQVTDNDLADRWSAITRQEGGIAASNVCLQAVTLFLPSPRDFFTPSQNRGPVHRPFTRRVTFVEGQLVLISARIKKTPFVIFFTRKRTSLD